MLVYWTMFAVPALSSLLVGPDRRLDADRSRVWLSMVMIAFTLLIGFRYEVGGDWFNYLRTINQLSYSSFGRALDYKDIGFGVVAWLSTRMGLYMLGANLFCGAVLIYGLSRFVRRQPDAWLAITAAVPYLIIVVGMGYVRQAAAIGFIFLALIQFEKMNYRRMAGWMFAAASFHASSLVILPLIALALARKRLVLLVPMGLATLILYVVIVSDRIGVLSQYAAAGMDSSGALVRLAMNAVPGLLFCIYYRRIEAPDHVKFFWLGVSAVSLAMIIYYRYTPSTTILDRIGLYFIPLQVFLFGHLSKVFDRRQSTGGRLVAYLVILYYGAVLYVWGNYASHAGHWLPYQFRIET